MSQAARALVTEEEFLSLPVSKQQVELVDGEVIASPSAELWHQLAVTRLGFELFGWAKRAERPFTVVVAPSDVRFGPDRILQPAVYVLDVKLPMSHKGPIVRIPIVCVEVVSDRVYDRITKRMIYAEAGVQEYWLVEHAGLIERRTGPGLAAAEEIRNTLETPLLPGFELDVRELFAD